MAGNNQYRAADFIDKIPGSGGIISTIAKRVGCSWHTAKKYCTEFATVRSVYEDECESITDLAESTVLKAIRDGDVSAAKWYLTMKAKDRGYAERRELSGPDGGPIKTQSEVDCTSMTDDELSEAIPGKRGG